MTDTRMPGRASPRSEDPGSAVNPDGTRNAHAVVVGINRYASDQIRGLRYARADAEAVAEVLVDPEYGRFPPDNVTLLVDDAASQRSIISAIGTGLRRSAKEDDLVCVYFAGHGAVEPNPESGSTDGTSKYLMAADTDPDDLFATAVAMDRVEVFFRRIYAKQVVFILDSCYSGGADTTPFRSGVSNDFLERLGDGEGRLVLTSCSPNELSLERADYGGGHGLFTHHLVEGLKGPADLDGDGLVTLDELYTYVHDRVKENSRQAGGSMTPIRTGSSTGQIYLTAYQSEEAKKAEALREAAQASFEAGDLVRAREAWDEALELEPEHEAARDGVASIRTTERHRTKALVDLNRADKLPDEILQPGLELLAKPLDELDDTALYRREKLIALCEGAIGIGAFVQVWQSTADASSATAAASATAGSAADSVRSRTASAGPESPAAKTNPVLRFMKEKPVVAGLSILAAVLIVGTAIFGSVVGGLAFFGGGSQSEDVRPGEEPTNIVDLRTAAVAGPPPLASRALGFAGGWSVQSTNLSGYPLFRSSDASSGGESNEVVLIPNDAAFAGSVVLRNENFTPPYQVEFEYMLNKNDDPAPGIVETGDGLVVMVQKNAGSYQGANSVPVGVTRGYIADGSGYGVHLTLYGVRGIEVHDGRGTVMANSPQDPYTGPEWHQAVVTVQSHRIAVQLDGGPPIQAIVDVDDTHGTLGFSAATGAGTNEARVRNVRIVPVP